MFKIHLILGCVVLGVTWFACFSSREFDLNDKDRPGRPIEANDSLLEKLLEHGLRKSTRDLTIQFNCSFNTV